MIALFDSGVGGLSVLKEIRKAAPDEDYMYFSDNAFCPYGEKPVSVIRERACEISRTLIGKGADIIVVACNTATAAAIDCLRENFDLPFIGMEPAIKPAAIKSRSKVIGVLATAGTFKGELYKRTGKRPDRFRTRSPRRYGVRKAHERERGRLHSPRMYALPLPRKRHKAMLSSGRNHQSCRRGRTAHNGSPPGKRVWIRKRFGKNRTDVFRRRYRPEENGGRRAHLPHVGTATPSRTHCKACRRAHTPM